MCFATRTRAYNGQATVEQRIEEIKSDLNVDGFCTKDFFATEAAFLAVLFAYNLMALYQGQVSPALGYRKPSTIRAAVFPAGAILKSRPQEAAALLASLGRHPQT